MKKILKWTSIIIIVLAIIGASGWGLYKNSKNEDSKYIRPYILGMEFKDNLEIEATVDTTVTTTIYDSEGNIVETPEEGIEYTEENGYTTTETKANEDSKLTLENFKKTKEVFKARLQALGVEQHSIKMDESTGKIKVEIPINEDSYSVLYGLMDSGTFIIIDSETEEVLLDNSAISKAQVMYSSTEDGTGVFLKINYNKEGQEKLKQLSEIYKETEQEQKNEETGETETVKTSKEIAILMSDYNLGSTVITNVLYDDSIMLTLGVSSNTEEINQYIESAEATAGIINSGVIPIDYTFIVNGTEVAVSTNNLVIYIIAITIVFAIALIYKIIKFKGKGLISVFLEIGYMAGLLLLIRYVNVIITIEGITGIVISGLLNYIFTFMLLEKENIKETFLQFLLQTVPIYVIAIIFSFDYLASVNSFGMALVWGIILLYVYNAIFTRTIFKMIIGGQNDKK